MVGQIKRLLFVLQQIRNFAANRKSKNLPVRSLFFELSNTVVAQFGQQLAGLEAGWGGHTCADTNLVLKARIIEIERV